MANPFVLARVPQLARLDRPTIAVAVVPDAEQDGVDVVRSHLDVLGRALDRERELLDALRRRRDRRPPAPERRTLADTVCATCRRLEDDRLADKRGWFDDRTEALTAVRVALDAPIGDG